MNVQQLADRLNAHIAAGRGLDVVYVSLTRADEIIGEQAADRLGDYNWTAAEVLTPDLRDEFVVISADREPS
jgi:hypothetical protein